MKTPVDTANSNNIVVISITRDGLTITHFNILNNNNEKAPDVAASI